ncbi:hypothetical protein J6590_031484 [Homalodisca vitripennis]|nr:hypothetical protein J6590_031484 [Homalodisca vitripennis]
MVVGASLEDFLSIQGSPKFENLVYHATRLQPAHGLYGEYPEEERIGQCERCSRPTFDRGSRLVAISLFFRQTGNGFFARTHLK